MTLHTIGRAKRSSFDIFTPAGLRELRPCWAVAGARHNMSDFPKIICLGDGRFLNQQTGEVLHEGTSFDHLYTADHR